jgi:hypothetical protein
MDSEGCDTTGNSSLVYLTDWRTSEAKKALQQLIRDGRVTDNHNAKVVYAMYGRFKEYDPKNLKNKLRNMRKSFHEGNLTRTSTPTAMNRASAEDKGPVYLKNRRWSKSKQVL